MYQKFHCKEKVSQILSKVLSQYLTQCHITSSFIETVPPVSFITKVQIVMSLLYSQTIADIITKINRIAILQNFSK